MAANFPALLTDVPAEAVNVQKFIAGIEAAVTDAKAQGLDSVTITAIEALVPEAQAVIEGGEQVATDLGV